MIVIWEITWEWKYIVESNKLWLLWIFFFKQKTAYEVTVWLEFRRVLFRSLKLYAQWNTGFQNCWDEAWKAYNYTSIARGFGNQCFTIRWIPSQQWKVYEWWNHGSQNPLSWKYERCKTVCYHRRLIALSTQGTFRSSATLFILLPSQRWKVHGYWFSQSFAMKVSKT